MSLEGLEGRVLLSGEPTRYTVNSTGSGTSGTGTSGTLPYVITQANANPNPAGSLIEFDPAVFSSPQTITVASTLTLYEMPGPEVIDGPGANLVTVTANLRARVFQVNSGVTVTISGLTITGGGILNSGTLSISDSNLSGNSVTGGITIVGAGSGLGGGIYSSGTLSISGSTFSGNSATGGTGFGPSGLVVGPGNGGAIYSSGTLSISNSTVSGNSAASPGYGGGIYSSGTLSISGSAFNGNSAAGPGNGGGIYSSNTLSISGSAFNGNSVTGVSTVSGLSPSHGGAIYSSGMLSISGSTFSGNSAKGPPNGNGGAIYSSSTLSISDSTFSGNSASGSIGTPYGTGGGGGISNSGTVSIADSTFADNSAAVGGGIALSGTGSPQAMSIDSIFQNGPGENISAPSDTTFHSLGHNLFSDAPPINLDPTDLINTDSLLAPLGDFGGPTLTIALLPGSPAIDAGTPVPGLTTDQRGVSRPHGSAPDIGAFESRGFTLTIASGDHQTTSPLSPFPTPLTIIVASSFGEPVAGGRVTFTSQTAGASADLTGNPATIDASGQAVVDASANGLLGTYTVSVAAAGAQGVAFTLTNAPPTVLSLHRFGFHEQPTQFVLTFDSPLDPARADDVRNYRLASIDSQGHLGKKLRIVSVVYDPVTLTVAIHPAIRVYLFRRYRLEVKGTAPDGLASPSGTLLDGKGNGQPGSDYVKVFGSSILAGPYRGFPAGTTQRARHSHADPAHSSTKAPRSVPHTPPSTGRSERSSAMAAAKTQVRLGAEAVDAVHAARSFAHKS